MWVFVACFICSYVRQFAMTVNACSFALLNSVWCYCAFEFARDSEHTQHTHIYTIHRERLHDVGMAWFDHSKLILILVACWLPFVLYSLCLCRHAIRYRNGEAMVLQLKWLPHSHSPISKAFNSLHMIYRRNKYKLELAMEKAHLHFAMLFGLLFLNGSCSATFVHSRRTTTSMTRRVGMSSGCQEIYCDIWLAWNANAFHAIQNAWWAVCGAKICTHASLHSPGIDDRNINQTFLIRHISKYIPIMQNQFDGKPNST